MTSSEEQIPEHHRKEDICYTRPPYRAPNKPNAVKVYTVSQESRYLLIQNVPALNLATQLAKLLNNSGTLTRFEKVEDFPREEFTEVYLAMYTTLSSARYVKKKFDDHVFYSAQLHITYAPEREAVSETRDKLEAFRRMSAKVINSQGSQNQDNKGKTALRKRFKPTSSDHKLPVPSSSTSGHKISGHKISGHKISGQTLLFPKTSLPESTSNTAMSIQTGAPNTAPYDVTVTKRMKQIPHVSSNPRAQQLYRASSHTQLVPRQVELRQRNWDTSGSSSRGPSSSVADKGHYLIRANPEIKQQEVKSRDKTSRTNRLRLGGNQEKSPKNLLISKELLESSKNISLALPIVGVVAAPEGAVKSDDLAKRVKLRRRI